MGQDVEIITIPRDSSGHFQKGYKGGPGRPFGSRPKMASVFWDDLYAVWKIKGAGVLRRLADKDPATFAKIAAMLVGKAEEVRSVDDMRDAVVEQFIEDRRQNALIQIAKMRGETSRAE